MNYRHDYHAGNFADVVKHSVLARIVCHLRGKPKPFRLIDTHAGAGLTDLLGSQASRTGEWRNGIGRLMESQLPPQVTSLLAPYLDAVAAYNPSGRLVSYPGSPLLARAWLRPDDRLVVCELQPDVAAALAAQMRGDSRVKVVEIDGWTALGAFVPPSERRGAVLIDPPFEAPGEFDRLIDGLAGAYRKWPTGTYVLWYPIKDEREVSRFAGRLGRLGIVKILRAELMVDAGADGRLRGAGLIIVNPPFTLHDELGRLLPALADTLGHDRDGRFRLDWLVAEK
jgi:23S rRNA (adenine2030-N6)-methyltransferase